ncbi:MAG: vitamin K epoxide reductase family protein [Chloroflexota bacterium]|nr:vitamin K epoxide reductase family protein [Chloroflexota bacterium]
MNRLIRILIILAILVPITTPASADDGPVVQAVLFYSPSCGHCHKVIQEDLPLLYEKHNSQEEWFVVGEPPGEETSELPPIVGLMGDTLQILYINAATPLGSELFGNALLAFEVPETRYGVPNLFIGETSLVGSVEIPELFPGLVDEALEQGGSPWPDIPGLEDAVELLVPLQELEPTAEAPNGGTPTVSVNPNETTTAVDPVPTPGVDFSADNLSVWEKFQLDPVGNSLSVIILIGMIASLAVMAVRWRDQKKTKKRAKLHWVVPVLALLGLVVAGYLAFIESTGGEAVCGPVGDCNTVQQSEYAFLFGVVSVGLLGMLSYIAILSAWLIDRWGSEPLADLAQISIFLMAFFGTLFSIYLTFLEPFVIGATCAWCLTSAVVITALMLISANPARDALHRLRLN